MQLFRFTLLRHAPNVLKRNFLSEAYSCTEKWNSRFSSQAFGNLSASDLGTQILHRLSNKAPVTSLDYDVFVNKVQETDKQFLEYLEKIMYKFQTTQNSLNTLASTSHAFVQNYIFHNEEYRLLELLRNRASTGVFLDEVSANHLLSRFVRKQDYPAAVAVMWELCLQSHLEQQPLTPYLTVLWLHTISHSIKSSKYFERAEVVEAPADDVDDGDTDFRSIPYLRNPNYDGWFDIHRPRLQLGHCALSLANAIERKDLLLFSDTLIHSLKEVSPSLSLLGFALVEDANRLLKFAKIVNESPELSECVGQEVLSEVERLIESSDRRPDDSEVKRGEPTLLTESDVDLTLKTFKELVPKIRPTNKSFHDTVDSLVSTVSKDTEILKAEQARVHDLYTSFETTREEIWRTEMERLRRREVLSSVKSRLRELADEEERLTYFDHSKEIEHKAWLAPRTRKERSWSRMKEWKKDLRNYQRKRQGGREAVEHA